MNLTEAQELTEQYLRVHGLAQQGWTFAWLHKSRTFGQCSYTDREICLSRSATQVNDIAQVRNTIIHEIAHALTPRHGHDAVWRRKCLDLGGDGKRCVDTNRDTVVVPPMKWIGRCPQCGWSAGRDRLTAKTRQHTICTPCADKMGRPYTEARVAAAGIKLRWYENHARVTTAA